MGITVAYLAETPGSPTLEQQKAYLAEADNVLIAGDVSFTRFDDLLARNGIELAAGDRVKIVDLTAIGLATSTLIKIFLRLLKRGIALEIASAQLVIEPDPEGQLHALLTSLDRHNSHLHGIKTNTAAASPRGRRALLHPERLPEIRARLAAPDVTYSDVARELGVARSTLFNFLERHAAGQPVGRRKKVGDRRLERDGDRAHIGQAQTPE